MQTITTPAEGAASLTQARQVALSMLLGSLRSDDLLRHRVTEHLARLELRPLGRVA